MKEKILRIEEVNEGFNIHTNKQSIEIHIYGGQQCCECFGYMSSPDDSNQFIGAILQSIKVVDSNHKLSSDILRYCGDLDCGYAMFVRLQTDKGDFEIAVYNGHNGYYCHNIKIKFNDTCIEECI